MSKQSQENSLLPEFLEEEVKKVSKKLGLSGEQEARLRKEVEKLYLQSRLEPGEAVGIVAAQSISEPATQMCTDGEEKILLRNGETIQVKRIGDFVDAALEKYGFERVGDYEVCDFPPTENIFALGLDPNEKLRWGRITSCVRLKATKDLIAIKTKCGRKIVATDSHSFVTRKNNRVEPVRGSELRVGDRIPVIKHLPMSCTHFVDVLNFVPSCRVTNDLVQASKNSKPIPRKIYLSDTFGWFVGAYLSEGGANGSQLRITNADESFIDNAKTFTKMMGLDYKLRVYRGVFGPATDFEINSSILSRFMIGCCGKGSCNKKVPEFSYSAPEEFVSALLRGYFDGDGNLSVKRKMIRAHSNSEELIDGIKLLLARFGILAYKKKQKKQWCLIIPYKYAPIFLQKIGSSIEEKRKKLQKLAELAKEFWSKKSQDFNDVIPGVGDLLYRIARKLKYPTRYVNNFTKRQKIGRATLHRYIKLWEKISKARKIDIRKELDVLKRALHSDVVWDEIVEIKRVRPSHPYVYDISVDGLETFTTFDGVVTHNTMRTYHIAGAAGIKVTYGLPRLIEIFDAKREPQTPQLTIYLKPKYNNPESARKLGEALVAKKLVHFLKNVSVNLSEGYVEVEVLDERKASMLAQRIKESLKVGVRKKERTLLVTPSQAEELQKLKRRLLELHVSGVKGIENAVVLREGNDWILRTVGTNLEEVLKFKEVDETRTISNNPHEVAKVLGIEAARNVIWREASRTLQEQALDVDLRHLLLVADVMTVGGEVSPIGRYGVAGSKVSVLARAAFEETIKHLVRASLRREEDKFRGIFENVMIGQVIPSGTGMFELLAEKKEEK